MRTDHRENKIGRRPSGIGKGLAIGTAIGVALGVSTNNIGLWLPVGIGCGLAIGSGFERRNKRSGTGNNQQPE